MYGFIGFICELRQGTIVNSSYDLQNVIVKRGEALLGSGPVQGCQYTSTYPGSGAVYPGPEPVHPGFGPMYLLPGPLRCQAYLDITLI